MHPIYTSRGRLGLYLLSWGLLVPPVAALLWRRSGEGEAWQAVALSLPLVLFYAYLCLAAWYLCRLAPLTARRPLYALAVHATGAALTSSVWLGFSWILAEGLAEAGAGASAWGEHLHAAALELFVLGFPLYGAAAAIHYLVLAADRSSAAERRELELTLQAREAELKALRAQLDPHFLFNSLNTIGAFAGSEPKMARKMAILLAEFLRRGLRAGAQSTIPLAEELAHAAGYLAIERIRFGERLTVEQEVADDCRRCLVPSLLLQPLIENAVRHGVAQLLEGGAVRLEARKKGGTLFLTVENPCDPDHPAPRGEGVGIANVRARLRAAYGAAGGLTVTTPPGSFRVELWLPALMAVTAVTAPETPGEEEA